MYQYAKPPFRCPALDEDCGRVGGPADSAPDPPPPGDVDLYPPGDCTPLGPGDCDRDRYRDRPGLVVPE